MRPAIRWLIILAALAAATGASAFEKGETLTVKPDRIWFEKPETLTRWQELKRSGDQAALAAYEDHVLGEREAWEFSAPLTVEVLGYDADRKQVSVEMKTPGRMEGTTWVLDAEAIAP